MPAALVKRGCPSCGSAENASTSAVATASPPGETLSLEQLRPFWNHVIKTRMFFTYYRCRRCGILFNPLFFSEADLAALYAGMPDNTAGIPERVLARTQQGYFDVFKRYSDLTGTYVELGPDLGLFTECAVRAGSFDNFVLFEPNQAVQSRLEGVVRGKTATIVRGLVTPQDIPDQTSTVVMIHVLDHLIEPATLLQSIRPKLTRNARVVIVTHDERSSLTKLLGARWGGYSLEHPQLFNAESMRTFLAGCGFETLAIEPTTNVFPMTHLLNQLLAVAGLKRAQLPLDVGPIVKLKLGNLITIAAPKH